MVVMKRSRRRMMAEATAESPTSILPEEVMIEILSRVELNHTLQLRCVCKSWKSLLLDPQFVKNHLFKLLNDINVLFLKARELFIAFKSQYLINNPVMPQEQEQVEDDDEDGEEAAQEDDDDAAAVEEEENVVDAATEEEEEEKEEKKEEDEKEKHWLITALANLDGVLVNVRSLKGDLKSINLDTQMQAVEDRMKCLRSFMRICQKHLQQPETSSSHF
ncbi:hypothetical protein TSUD_368020 [Trifolium subterraneum]|uniref:F-box domain-containing protein n=1 Tax=Trifolium subterraneum TaxID=3900 RepID=A0A2Z6LI63_TRISU|nr:hypothetical protein TSUD_368020 [Trifolium subterraneum]